MFESDYETCAVEGVSQNVVVVDDTYFSKQDFQLKADRLYVNEMRVTLFSSELQRTNLKLPRGSANQKYLAYVEGKSLRQHLERKKMLLLGAQTLDGLLECPEFIPRHWREEHPAGILFWGTIYRELPAGCLLARSLCWSGVMWVNKYLDIHSHIDIPAAIIDTPETIRNPKGLGTRVAQSIEEVIRQQRGNYGKQNQ